MVRDRRLAGGFDFKEFLDGWVATSVPSVSQPYVIPQLHGHGSGRLVHETNAVEQAGYPFSETPAATKRNCTGTAAVVWCMKRMQSSRPAIHLVKHRRPC